jgi:FKBP-type peptidyl-prolyl cis-trans isomerase
LPKGVLEATKLIGKGGHIEAWVPSQLGYGADGCDSLGVKPNTILYYEMWLVDVEKR